MQKNDKTPATVEDDNEMHIREDRERIEPVAFDEAFVMDAVQFTRDEKIVTEEALRAAVRKVRNRRRTHIEVSYDLHRKDALQKVRRSMGPVTLESLGLERTEDGDVVEVER